MLNNRYRILAVLGQGGSGKTFLAEDTHLPSKRKCVVKQLNPGTQDEAIRRIIKERFEREAVILESLGRSHRQIPGLYAYFTEQNEFYLVQELIEGHTLTQLVRDNGICPEQFAREFLISLLDVLSFLHSSGIIHRDIKPDNVMLRQSDGKPVLIDFGAVREIVTNTGTDGGPSTASIVIGSPGYMPIEQAAGTPVYASDLFSLGMTTIFLLTGKHPREMIDRATGLVLWRQYAPFVSEAFARILDKAIDPSLTTRFRNAQEMIVALNFKAPVVEKKRTGIHPIIYAIGSVLVLLLTMSLIGSVVLYKSCDQPHPTNYNFDIVANPSPSPVDGSTPSYSPSPSYSPTASPAASPSASPGSIFSMPDPSPGGTPLPEHVIRNAKGNLEPASGYTWTNPSDQHSYDVKLREGLAVNNGNFAPAPGYEWTNPKDKSDLSVRLKRGIQKTSNGLRPLEGYEWVNPSDPNDVDVKLKEGLSRTSDGNIQPSDGWEWVNPSDPKDLSVRRKSYTP